MAPWQHRVGRQLNLIIVSLCAVALVSIWLITFQRCASEREQAVAAAMNSNSNLAIAFEQQVFRTLKAAEQVAAFVRERYLEEGPGIDLRQWAERQIIRETMFTIISVVDEEGYIVSSSQPTGQVNYSDRAFFQAQRNSAQDTLFVSLPVLGRVSGRVQIPMSLRISRPDGSFGGVVVMSVDPDNFTGLYHHADLGGRGLLELTNLDGVVLGRKIGKENSSALDAADVAWLQQHATAPEGQFVDDGAAVDGVARIISYRAVEGYPLVVAVGTAYADELEPVRQRQSYYLGAAGSATIALLFFSRLLISMLGRQRKAADALLASEALYRAAFHQAAMGIAHVAPDGRILGANEKFCQMLGYSEDELQARTLFELSDSDDREAVQQFLKHRLSANSSISSLEIEKTYRRKDGSTLWVCEALGVVKDPEGKPEFLVAVTQDITARKVLEARLSHDALHDALTGLPNRVLFQDRLAQALESASRHGCLAAVLYLDLDGFKSVNDSRGHTAGDKLLQLVAQRLRTCVRAEDTAARVGGDEFGIVLTALTDDQDYKVVAQKLIDTLSKPYELEGLAAHISASVGVAVFPRHGETAAALLAHADSAMYAAKQAGKNRYSDVPLSNLRRPGQHDTDPA